jgi:hypothetical protein
MPARQTQEEFARANGFSSYEALLAASRHLHFHDGIEHFAATTPDGREILWDENDIDDIEVGRSPRRGEIRDQ